MLIYNIIMANPSKTISRTKRRRRYGYGRRYRRTGNYGMIKSIINKTLNKRVEKKYFDLAVNHTSSNLGQMFDITSFIQQGNTRSTRIGNKIYAISLFFRIVVNGVDAPGNVTRAMFVQGKEVLVPTFHIPSVYSAMNTDVMRILYDKVTFQSDTTAQNGNNYVNVYEGEIFINKVINYTANTGAIGDTTNGIYFMTVTDSIVAAHPQFSGLIRLKYRDA